MQVIQCGVVKEVKINGDKMNCLQHPLEGEARSRCVYEILGCEKFRIGIIISIPATLVNKKVGSERAKGPYSDDGPN